MKNKEDIQYLIPIAESFIAKIEELIKSDGI